MLHRKASKLIRGFGMFGFLFQKRRDEVRRLLATRMNSRYVSQFRYGNRTAPRGPLCDVVWIIPCGDGIDAIQIDQAYPVVTKDISPDGLALIHQRPISGRLLVGLQGPLEMKFILSQVEHRTPLGYGFYQIGVNPEEIVALSPEQNYRLRQRMTNFENSDDADDKIVLQGRCSACPSGSL